MKKQYIIIVVAATVLTFLSAFIFNACKKVDFDPVTKSYIKDTHSIDTTSCTLYLKIHSLNPKFSHPDYGICYSSSNAEPSIDNNKIRFGAITDTLTKTVIVKNLKHGTRYYFRSFVMDEENAKYGDVISLTIPITVAKLTTNEVSNITATYASCGGNITSDGGSSITARGVCWSTSQNPTTSNSKTTIGSGFGSFKSAITGLTAGTTYYVRAYATNSVGTQYGNQVSFKTLVGVPSLTTKEISNITATSASCGGNITSDGGSSVTARGVCWSTSQNPTISSSHSTSVGGTGSFSSSITGLTANTTYYVRAYATNSIGTQYGNQLSFQTPFATGSFTDSRDG
ncbi:MAG: hypothetical protein GX793_10375, partial [Bacteroidales bacterium]|nr:hypothetical protein [Bacteroidales bacterium]